MWAALTLKIHSTASIGKFNIPSDVIMSTFLAIREWIFGFLWRVCVFHIFGYGVN